MVMGAVNQMLRDVAWGALDIWSGFAHGTGDAQLSIVQNSGKNGKLAGAVIVYTPQDIALIDARKGLKMFQKVNVPILGIIENMSYFRCPHCHEVSDIFGHGGAEAEAKTLGCDFLGAIPLHLSIRQTSDAGHPIMLAAPLARKPNLIVTLPSGCAMGWQDMQLKTQPHLKSKPSQRPSPNW